MQKKSPSHERISKLVELRLLVGFLGQRKNGNWWNCDFLDPVGVRFLEATFPKTARKAALRSTCEAAARFHDQALGRIGTYHLFRLPVQLEVLLEGFVESFDWDSANLAIASRESALQLLNQTAGTLIKAPQGAVQIGVEDRILAPASIVELAAHYHSAFQQGIQSFPYFAPKNHAR